MRRPSYQYCASCGSSTSHNTKRNRVNRNGVTQNICPSCRYDLPEAQRRLEQGASLGHILHSMGIPPKIYFRPLLQHVILICRGPCARAIFPEMRLRLHPVSGQIFCTRCYGKARLPCSICGQSTRLPRGVIDRQKNSSVTLTCRNCLSLRALNPPQRCSEPGCATPIGRRLKRACHHPEDPTRRVCETCYMRIRARLSGPFTCPECRRTRKSLAGRSLDPRRSSRHICSQCYQKLSGYFEARTDTCPVCGKRKLLQNQHPNNKEQKVCSRCSHDLSAPRKIIRLSQATRTWPQPHQRLFDAALQRGSEVAGDLLVLKGLIQSQPLLPSDLELSNQNLARLHRWFLDDENISLSASHQRFTAVAIYRARLQLYGPTLDRQRYRLLLNRQPLTHPIPAAELLLDFVEKELPTLHYSPITINLWFGALRRFFRWLAEHHPEVYFLRQIDPKHFAIYQANQGVSASLMYRLQLAWKAFEAFVAARGHLITIGASPWEDLTMPTRVAPVYSDPLAILQGLDAMARDDRYPPLDRMLAHLLALAAPSYEEISQATIPTHTPEGVPILRRSLVASCNVTFPSTGGSRRRHENYRQLASSTSWLPLRAECEYLALYEAVDQQRQAILRSTDCSFLFVNCQQRVSPRSPVASCTINHMLHRVFRAIGFSDLQLRILRNSHALAVAQEVSPRPAVIAAATGRSFNFATKILRSMDLDPLSGLRPLPKVALVRDDGKSRS